MTPQILLYNIQDPKHRQKLKALVLRLKIRIRIVDKEQYANPIGCLCGMDLKADDLSYRPQDTDTSDFTDEMLIFAFFSDALLNQFLAGLRKSGLQIPLKAILTPTNCTWNSYMVHHEISAEHQRMHSQDTSSDISLA